MAHEALVQGLRIGPEVLRGLLAGIPEQKLHLRRGEGFWTVYEHVEHLGIVQLMLFKRLERFSREDEPEFVPYIPDEKEKPKKKKLKPVSELLSYYSRWRDRQLELIEGADQALWRKAAIHPEYERYGFEILVRHILLHDYFHLYRMEELSLSRDDNLSRM